MNRRNFIRTTTVTSIALSQTSALFALEAKNAYCRNMGLQLYTLRNEIAKDPVSTLNQVAAAGYKQVELFGFPNAAPMIAAAKDAGLKINSAHFEWDAAVNPKDDAMSDFAKILDQAKTVGLRHLVIPYLADSNRQSLDDYKKVAANANKAAAMAKKAGIQLSYHNHNFEFEPKAGGKTGFDIFVAEFSPEMRFEIDAFWVKAGGLEPAALITKLSGRVSQVHLKDLKEGIKLPSYSTGLPKEAFQEVGNGVIPTEPILVAAKNAGVEHCHVEQDQSPAPLKSVKQSMDYLQKF
jgi:sugar phosphate isomerase/epimerase